MDAIYQLEQLIINKLEWPSWTLRLNVSLTALVIASWALQQILFTSSTPNGGSDDDKIRDKSRNDNNAPPKRLKYTWEFRMFQMQYLSVYLITMLADWLQGTHMYTLYSVSNTLSSM